MFVCESCLEKETGRKFDSFIPVFSQGPCEICKTTSQCLDLPSSLFAKLRKGAAVPSGLYHKFDVRDAKTGNPVEGFTFVLRPETDRAARVALAAYATSTTNQSLATDLEMVLEGLPDDLAIPAKVFEQALSETEVRQIGEGVAEQIVAGTQPESFRMALTEVIILAVRLTFERLKAGGTSATG